MKIEFFESIKNRDPAAKSYLEIILCYPGVHALFLYHLSRFFDKLRIPILPRMICNFSRIITGIEIHHKAKIGKNLFIDHGTGVVIGETTIIGDNVTLYQNVTLGGRSIKPGKRHPTIEDNVIIGSGAKILGNITISKNCKIGPSSLVLESVGAGKIMISQKATELKKKEVKDQYDLEYYI